MTGATTPANNSQSPDLTARPFNRIAIQSKRALLKGSNQPILAFDLRSNKKFSAKSPSLQRFSLGKQQPAGKLFDKESNINQWQKYRTDQECGGEWQTTGHKLQRTGQRQIIQHKHLHHPPGEELVRLNC